VVSYSIKALDKSAVMVAPTNRITSIAGTSRELYITDVRPYPSCGRPTLRRAEKVVIEPLSFSGGAVTAGPPKTFKGQVDFEISSRHSASRSPDGPESRGSILFLSGETSKVSQLVEIEFTDSLSGFSFSGLYQIRYLPPPTLSGGNPDLYIPASEGPGTPVPITPVFVSLSEQSVFEGAAKIKTGDALIRIPRTQLTEAHLQADRMLIEITPKGGSARMYQLWNSDGIKPMQTLHWEIYLKRVRP